jgi:hypothetical protein
MISVRPTSILATLCLWILPGTVHAQFQQGGPAGANPGWAPAGVGVRVGFDNAQSRPMLGAMLRLPVLPSGRVELLPNADVTFLPGLKQYQVNFELVYVLDGRRGGFYGGGGMGLRNSIFEADPAAARENKPTYSLVFGIRFGAVARIRPELETRWIFLDQQVRDPRSVTFGATIALW